MDFKPSDSDQSERVSALIIASCICCSITIIAIVIPIINLYSPKPYVPQSSFINNQTTTCQLSFTPMVSLGTRSGPVSIATGDFNKDRHLDLVVVHSLNSTTSILLGDGAGNFNEVVFSNGAFAAPNTVVLGDINNDTNVDILVVNNGNSDVSIFLGQANGNFIEQTSIPIGANTSAFGLALGDVDGDDIIDLIVSDSIQYHLLIFSGIGDGTFAEPTSLNTGDFSRPYSVVTADLNGDTSLDLLVTNTGTNEVGVFLSDALGGFGELNTYPTDDSPNRLITADFNLDGALDVATTNFLVGTVSVFLGYGNGTLAPQISLSIGVNSTTFGLARGNLNNDTIPDLVVANPNQNNIMVFIGRGDGRFDQGTAYSTGDGSSPDDVAIGDFNEDGRLDIVSANYLTESIGFFFNTCV